MSENNKSQFENSSYCETEPELFAICCRNISIGGLSNN